MISWYCKFIHWYYKKSVWKIQTECFLGLSWSHFFFKWYIFSSKKVHFFKFTDSHYSIEISFLKALFTAESIPSKNSGNVFRPLEISSNDFTSLKIRSKLFYPVQKMTNSWLWITLKYHLPDFSKNIQAAATITPAEKFHIIQTADEPFGSNESQRSGFSGINLPTLYPRSGEAHQSITRRTLRGVIDKVLGN